MLRQSRRGFLGSALVGCLALALTPAVAQSAFEVDTFPFGHSVGIVAVSERTGRVYVAADPFSVQGSAGRPITVFDGETHAPLPPLVFEPDDLIGGVVVHPTNGRLYVSLLNKNVVAIINEDTGQTVKRIQVQNLPLRMVLDLSVGMLYVAHKDSAALSTINTLRERVEANLIGSATLATLGNPATSAGLAVDTRNGRIFHRVTNTQNGQSELLWLFREPDRIRDKLLFVSGRGEVVFNPVTGVGYMALEERGEIMPFTGVDALRVSRPIGGPLQGSNGLAIDPFAGRLYVTALGSNRVGIFDASPQQSLAPTLRAQVDVGSRPRAIAVNSQTRRAYVLNSGDPSISVIRDRNVTLTLPTVTASPNIASNEWTNQDVTLGLALRASFTTGPQRLVFQIMGAKEIPRSTPASTLIVLPFTEEGSSTVFYAARGSDNVSSEPNPAISLSPPGRFQVNIDKTSPVVTLGAVDRERWFGGLGPQIAVTATDALSGLADPEQDSAFSLRATVQPGEETTNASTDSRTVRDLAGNSVTAGPITGIKIDRKVPTITVLTPPALAAGPTAGGSFLLNEKVLVSFNATDGGSGLKSLASSVPNGDRLPTGQVGRQSLELDATDNVGNRRVDHRQYTVEYGVKRLDIAKFKVRGKVALKLQLQDFARKNQSSRAITVTALRIESAADGSATPLNQPFLYNKKLGGKGGGYQLTFSFKSLPKGAYRLRFTAGGDVTEHEAPFTLR